MQVSIRNYKKKYYICKDDFGKKLYVGDIVEIYLPCELRSTWTSEIAWSMLHGAWVDSHPSHKIFSNDPEHQRMLYPLLNQSEITMFTDDGYVTKKGYCKKIKSFNKK